MKGFQAACVSLVVVSAFVMAQILVERSGAETFLLSAEFSSTRTSYQEEEERQQQRQTSMAVPFANNNLRDDAPVVDAMVVVQNTTSPDIQKADNIGTEKDLSSPSEPVDTDDNNNGTFLPSNGKKVDDNKDGMVSSVTNQTDGNNDNEKNTTNLRDDNVDDNSKDGKRNFFIIHVGVPKTGSTAIQDETRDNLTNALAQDHAIWVGRWKYRLSGGFRNWEACVKRKQNSTTFDLHADGDACWKQNMVMKGHPLMDKPSNHPNVSIVTSYEDYAYFVRSNNTMIRFQCYFQDIYNYQIVGVIGYRHFYEYALSNSLQTYKRFCLSEVPNSNTMKWLHQGGKPCKNLWGIASKLVMSKDYRGDFWVNIDELLPELRSLGMDMRVMNYNAPEYKSAITQNFYCGMLGNFTPNTCQESLRMQERQKAMARKNVGGVVYAYDAIILKAAELGLVNTTSMTRKEARDQLIHHHTQVLGKTFTDLPLMCPPQSAMDWLLEKSLALEEKMSVDLYGTKEVPPEIKAQHIEEFNKKVYTKRGYCSVNIGKLFANVTTHEDLYERLAISDWGKPSEYSK